MLFPLNELIAGRTLTTVEETTKLSDALRLMITNDFSYLPVVNAQQKLTGMLSEQIIVRKYYHFGGDKLLYDLEVAHCQMRATTLPPTADIFDALTPLQTVGAIIVTDAGKPIGIVTDYDTTRFFHSYSEGIILAQDIEFNLRRHIEDVFPPNSTSLDTALVAAFGHTRDQRRAGRPQNEYEELSLWQHVLFILTDSNWTHFEQALKPKDLFRKLLEPVKDARNQMAHFRGELTAVQLDALKQARYWLENRPVASTLQADASIIVDVTADNSDSVDGSNVHPSNNQQSSQIVPSDASSTEDTQPVVDDQVSPPTYTPNLEPAEHLNEQKEHEAIEIQGTESERKLRGKYAPLEQWLRGLAEEQTHIRVDFREIEKLIGEALPPSASTHSNWWANDSTSRSQSIAWLQAGWRVESVELSEGKVIFRRENSALMQSFFADVLTRFKQHRPEATRATRIQPHNWFSFGAGKTGFLFNWSFSYTVLRVELYIDTGDYDQNKKYLNILQQETAEIEAEIGQPLIWQRLENRRAARVLCERAATITDTSEALEGHKRWAVETMITFVDTLQPRVRSL